MTNQQRAKYESWNKGKLITEINRLMRERDSARTDAIDEFADYVLNQFAPLFTKEELVKQFKEQLKEQNE